MVLVSVVILTMGDRSEELSTAVESVRSQTGVDSEVIVVINGGKPDNRIADVLVQPTKNLGIPGGRNAGASVATGEYILFLDDDAALANDDVLVNAVKQMEVNNKIAVLALQIFDQDGKVNRRHHPRLLLRSETPGYVTSFPGGASFIRKTAFIETGGFCHEYFYGLEETDLAWRLYNFGWRIKYCPDLKVYHPRTSPERHESFFFNTARNRVWLSYRQLPAILAILYVSIWICISLTRNLFRFSAWKALALGTISGINNKVGERNPISWKTVLVLTRFGRPPII